MDITREVCDQFKTTSHQQRCRWKTIKMKHLQVQIEAQLSMDAVISILNLLRCKNIFLHNNWRSYSILLISYKSTCIIIFYTNNNSCHCYRYLIAKKIFYLYFVKEIKDLLHIIRFVLIRLAKYQHKCKMFFSESVNLSTNIYWYI